MRYCDYCEREMAVMTCDYCCNKHYCSEECKNDQYKFHKIECPPPEGLRSVDYLIRDVWKHQMPTNEATLKDYGFTNCKRKLELNFLLGLYVRLITYRDVEANELHDHCMKNNIAELIHETYGKLKPIERGEHYTWFLRHEYIVQNSNKPEEDTVDGKVNDMTTSHRNSSSEEDTFDSKVNVLTENYQNSSINPQNKKKKKFSFKDGNITINYGYNEEPLYYFFNVQDTRLASSSGTHKGVDKLVKSIDSSGSGILLQLYTCSKPSNGNSHYVTLDTFVEFLECYKIRKSHINKIRQMKPL